MTDADKKTIKTSLGLLTMNNHVFRAVLAIPPTPAIGGMPPMPIHMNASFAPYLAALKTHADEFDKLLKLVEQIIDRS